MVHKYGLKSGTSDECCMKAAVSEDEDVCVSGRARLTSLHEDIHEWPDIIHYLYSERDRDCDYDVLNETWFSFNNHNS